MDHASARESKAVEKYLLGELSPEEREEFELHFFDCAECADELRIASLFEANVRAVFAEGYAPKKWWQSFAETWAGAWRQPALGVPAFAALLLIGVLGYENAVLRRQAEMPQQTTVVTLRGAARGAEEAANPIEISREASSFLLSFDVTEDPRPARVRCEIQDQAGKSVAALDAGVPESGSVALWIPTRAVGPGTWRVVVRDASSGHEISHYILNYRTK